MIKNAEYVEGVETVESVMERDGYIKIESVFLIVFIVSQQKIVLFYQGNDFFIGIDILVDTYLRFLERGRMLRGPRKSLAFWGAFDCRASCWNKCCYCC